MAVLQGEASGWIWDNGLYSCICLGWWVPREYYCFRQATTLLLSIRTLESQLRGPLILRVLASYVTLPPQCPLCQPCPISQVRKLSPVCWCLRRLCAFLKLKARRAIWTVHWCPRDSQKFLMKQTAVPARKFARSQTEAKVKLLSSTRVSIIHECYS